MKPLSLLHDMTTDIENILYRVVCYKQTKVSYRIICRIRKLCYYYFYYYIVKVY